MRMRLLLAVTLMAAALCGFVNAQGSSLLQLVAANPRLKTLSGLLQQPVYARIAQLLGGRGDRTFLAPTDDAFAAVPNFDPANVRVVSATLLYHILSPRLNTAAMKSRGHAFVPTLMNDAALVGLGAGKSQVVQVQARGDSVALIFGMPHNSTWEAAIVQPDIAANNGVMHVIDKVLGIPRGATEAARLGGLDALIANLRSAGLLDIAENTPGLTIFAPTNEAFDAFQRLRDANPSLDQSAVMRQHLLPQLMYSPQLKDGATLQTLAAGKTVHIARNGAGMTVNGVPIRTSDVLLKNGVVHIITKVLGTD